MTSPVKLMLYALLATASLALPTQTNEKEAPRTCPSRMIADFDELKLITPNLDLPLTGDFQIVPDGYKDVKWNKGFRYTNSPAAVSKSNLALSDNTTALTGPPRIELYDNVQSFNLRSVSLDCRLNDQGTLALATKCVVTVTGTKTNGAIFKHDFFNIGGGEFKKCTLPSPEFSDLKAVEFSRVNTEPALTLVTLIGYDNIEFDIFKYC